MSKRIGILVEFNYEDLEVITHVALYSLLM